MTKGWLKGLFCVFLMLLCPATRAADKSAIIVENSDKTFLNQSIVMPTSRVDDAIRFKVIMLDALLMLRRQCIYNHASLNRVLVTSYRNRKPMISRSPADDTCRYLAHVIRLELQKRTKSGKPYLQAHYDSFATSARIASALDLTLSTATELRSQLDRTLR